MTPVCFLAALFGVLCTLAAFFAGAVYGDAKSMTRSADSAKGSKK